MTSVLDTLLGEAEVGKPGTNWKQVTPEHRKKIGPIVRHYMKDPHPFTACVRDNTKRFGPEGAKRVCAVVKDMGERTTKWRKGGKVREDAVVDAVIAEMVAEAQARLATIEDVLGEGAAAELAELRRTGNRTRDALIEGAYQDRSLLFLAGVMAEDEFRTGKLAESFNEKLHPRAHGGEHGGEFVRKLFGSPEAGGVKKLTGVISPRSKSTIPEGSGPKRPASTRLGGKGAHDQLARETKGVNQRKLTAEELPSAVGHGPWDAKVAETVRHIQQNPGAETDKLYRTPAGHYTPERTELHARIVRALLQGAGSHPDDKQAIFLAGGPASGKSSLLKAGIVKTPADAVDINPDIVKSMLPEYQALVKAGDQQAAGAVHEESAHIAKLLTNLSIAREHHIVVDGTGNSQPGKFASKVQKAVDHGYATSVDYATIPTEEAVRRANVRANDPKSDSYGRVVNEGFLRSAHASVSARFRDDIQHMKGVTVHVWDTTSKKPKEVFAKVPGEQSRVKAKPHFERFLGKADEGAK